MKLTIRQLAEAVSAISVCGDDTLSFDGITTGPLSKRAQ